MNSKTPQDPRRAGCKATSLSKSLPSPGLSFLNCTKRVPDSLILKGPFHHWKPVGCTQSAKVLDSRANTKPHHRILPAPRTDTWKPSSGLSPVTGHRRSYCHPCQVPLAPSLRPLAAPAAHLLQWPLGGSVAPNLGRRSWAPAPTGAGRILEFWECLTPPGTHAAPRGQPQSRGLPRCSQPGCGLTASVPHLPQQNVFRKDTAFIFVFSQEWGTGIGLRLLALTRMSL